MMYVMNDETTALDASAPELLLDQHVKYIQALDTKKNDLEYWLTEHLRVNGLYWGATALHILGHPDALDQEQIVEYLVKCQHDNGGIGGHIDHDPHILSTLSAIQILITYDRLDAIQVDKVVDYIASLQNEDGSFSGDSWGETDTRFIFCAINCLSLLKRLDDKRLDLQKTIDYVVRCRNFDGGFGSSPGGESHAAQVYVCVGTLTILGALHHVDADQLGWWLSERQLKNGGLNGRPEKLEDVCYSWWVLSSLSMLKRTHWIDAPKLIRFILEAQDTETGGIADRPGNMPDVFHTVFGIAGLSLLGYPGLVAVDPVYCMPRHVIQRIGLADKH
ncbi:MAG: terpenoid cyclases/protein prenyltransferase alpha-alpha toroid [Linnemannia gamsii]|nr:MAG: terpenoid cyclases/protein prenyltransferase alpha-alpha toroid [Linnemannia gamsii]